MYYETDCNVVIVLNNLVEIGRVALLVVLARRIYRSLEKIFTIVEN
jgi:hypothetical protein